MNDVISRQAAIDEAEEWIEVAYCEDGDQRERDAIKHIIHEIKNLPSVQPEHWIPCSERLPKKDGDYYVTTHNGQIARYLFIKGASEEYWMRCAIAWMPLPAPYRKEGEK